MRNAQDSILTEAHALVYGQKEQLYGDATADMERVATMWTAILGTPVEPWQIPLCMVAIKLSRLCHKRYKDGWVDVAGWADVGAQVDCEPAEEEVGEYD